MISVLSSGFLTLSRMSKTGTLFLCAGLAMFAAIPGAGCTPEPLQSRPGYYCADYDAESGNCTNAGQRLENGTVVIELGAIHSEKAHKSWHEFNYYIYFEKPVTVGLFVPWNRSASLDDRMELRSDLKCEFQLGKKDGVEVSGELEGKRLEEKGVWCFDYLGTLMAHLQKKEGTIEASPSEDYFPVQLTLILESSKKHLRREDTRNILVHWK